MPTAFENLAPRVMRDLIRDLGITDIQAAGILGNLGQESGLTAIQEHSPTSGRGGFGWAQWTGSRRYNNKYPSVVGSYPGFEQWCDERGLDRTSYEANYGFLVYELTKTTESKALRMLKLTTTVKAATETFEFHYERAGIRAIETRVKFANRALELYRASLGSTPVPTPTPIPVPPIAPIPWYKSRTIVYIIMTVVIPILGLFIPGLAGVDPNMATDWAIKFSSVAGTLITGYMAIRGRLNATQPIQGTEIARQAEAVQSFPQAAGINLSDFRMVNLPIGKLLTELPEVIELITEFTRAARPAEFQQQRSLRDVVNLSEPERK